MPDLSRLTESEKKQISMSQDGNAAVVRVTGEVSEAIEKALTPTKKAHRDTFQRDVRIHNQAIQASKAPSENGALFGSLPQVCIVQQGEIELVEGAALLHAHNWTLLDYPAELPNFTMRETSHSFTIDMDGKELSYAVAGEKETIAFNEGFTDVTEQDLVRWMDRKLRRPDILQTQLIQFLARAINKLLQTPNVSLTALTRNKFPLSRAIADLIRLHRQKAQKAGYQKSLFGNDNTVCLARQFNYSFNPDHYPSRPPYYSGRYKFQKHYFPQNLIDDLKASGEEYECAKAIDGLSGVKYWIRNLVRRERASFWLPLAHTKFYPDFVCELEHGRMLVVEYKGDAYVSNDDSAEKRAIGDKWAELSEGKCLFIMAVEQDAQGRDVRQQILNVIGSK